MPKAPRSSRAKRSTRTRLMFHDKAIYLEGGGYQCRRCGMFRDTQSSLEEHWRKTHKETLPCLLCRVESKNGRDAREHHTNQHTRHKGEDKNLCEYCFAALSFAGRAESRHKEYCPRPEGIIQDGWVWDEEHGQAFRTESKSGQDFSQSLNLCRANMPRLGMRLPSIPPTASGSPRLAQTATPSSISAAGQQATPVTLPQVNIYARPSTPLPLSPKQIHPVQTFNAAAQSSQQEGCPSPQNLKNSPVDQVSAPHDVEYEKWFDSLVQIPDNAVSASSPSHSLSKRSLLLTPRQASRYPDVSSLSSSLAKMFL